MSSTDVWSVASRVHNTTGYWGDVDATHAFCEPHYSTSPYFAEFYNSVSSMIFVVTGIYAFAMAKNDVYIQIAALWLVFIGVGSALFHGIMWYWMQLLDELPMVGFMMTLMLAYVGSKNPILNGKRTFLRVFILIECIGVAVVYIITQQYEIFFHGFVTIITTMGLLTFALKQDTGRHVQHQNTAFRNGVGAIIVGRIFWESENRLCETYPAVWPLHVGWHLVSNISAYYTIMGALILRLDEAQELPVLVGFPRKQKTT